MSNPSIKQSAPQKRRINFKLEVFQLDQIDDNNNLEIVKKCLLELFEKSGITDFELQSTLRGKHLFISNDSKGIISKDSYSTEKKTILDDDPCLDLWKVSIEIPSTILKFEDIIQKFSEPLGSLNRIKKEGKKRIGFLWRCSEERIFDSFIIKISELDIPFHRLKFSSFSFGNFINGTIFAEQFNSASRQTHGDYINSLECGLLHTHESMELMVDATDHRDTYEKLKTFKLVFSYKSVKQVTISQSLDSGYKIFFHLSHPPKIFISTYALNPDVIDMKKSKFWSFNYDRYQRDPTDNQRFDQEFWTRWHECGCIPSECIGKSSVFALTIKNERFCNIMETFYVWRKYSQLDISYGYIDIVKTISRPILISDEYPFEVKYAIECILSVSYAFQDDLNYNNESQKFEAFIKEQIKAGNTDWLVTTIYRLCYNYLYGRTHHALSKLECIFKRIEKVWPSIRKIKSSSNSYIKHLRRVLFTPTRMLILPELAFQSSQFLEIADLDCVLRLTIRDEDMEDLGYACTRLEEDLDRENGRINCGTRESRLPSPETYFLQKCVSDRLSPCYNVAGKSYQIYGASSSQLREHGMVLYAKDKLGRDHIDIRNEIGKINCKEISKYVSRVGLSLTQVLAFVDIGDVELRYTEDVLNGQHPKSMNPYNFTDGCGLMSRDLAEFIWKDLKDQDKLNPDEEDRMPTAYQIRFMGCKGMIFLDQTLIGKVIVIRESMRKIECAINKLGIVKISEPRRAYLNRPLITILNQIGLSNDFFVDLLYEAIGDLIDSFQSKIKASQALKMFSCLQRFINHPKLAELDYDILGDPFFRSALNLVFHQALEVIKQKARIPLNMDKARTLFGVADPTGTRHLPYAVIPTKDDEDQLIKIFDHNGKLINSSPVGPKRTLFLSEEATHCLKEATKKSFEQRKGCLKYGQVFIFPSDYDKPITREVIVTKFPCMHPGDVMRLEAVDVPELYGIRDCIVFPVDGPRPHSNEMAGSDLDGDEYCVIWSSEFVNNIQISEPMDFPDEPADGSITIDDDEIMKFFMRYIRDSSIGTIATTHLVWADRLPLGIGSDLCLTLAEKYSVSLDFVKTGITKMLRKEEKYFEAPDFLQKWNSKASYHSARALGAIYKTICMFELFLAEETSRLKIIDPSNDPRFSHPKWCQYHKQAVEQHEIYCAIVSYLLEINEFGDEVELFTQITEKSSSFGSVESKVQRPTNYQDTMIYCVNHLLVKPMEENFYAEFKSEEWAKKSEEELNEAYKAKALAYYKISMRKVMNVKKPFCGLPWIGKYSAHLFELLQTSTKTKESDNRMIAKLQVPTVSGGGFNCIEITKRHDVKDSCWKVFKNWLNEYLYAFNAKPIDHTRILGVMNTLFQDVASYYIKDERKKSSAAVLREIFLKIKSIRDSLSFDGNFFDSMNEPIGLMMVLILEKKYYEGMAIRKLPDDSFYCWGNATYNVLLSDENYHLEQTLSDISGCVSIVVTSSMGRNPKTYKLSIFGSRASILICQVIIGLHNRIVSELPHYKITM